MACVFFLFIVAAWGVIKGFIIALNIMRGE